MRPRCRFLHRIDSYVKSRTGVTMIRFRQKPNHCFVACLASCLADNGGAKPRELLVRFFPEKLRYGQGVPPAVIKRSKVWIRRLGVGGKGHPPNDESCCVVIHRSEE